MRARQRHRMLSGLRVLAIPQSAALVRNHANRGAIGTAAGTSKTRLGAWPALTYVPASSSLVTLGTPGSYGLDGPNLTVMARVKPASAPSVGSAYGVVTGRAAFPSAEGFVLFLGNTPASSENGYVLAVQGPGPDFIRTHDNVGAANLVGKNIVVAGVYRHFQRSVAIYHNGVVKGATVNAGVAWDPIDDTQALLIGGFPAGLYMDGTIGWAAIFDRALTPDELADWADDDDWAFLRDDDILIEVSGGGGIGAATAHNYPPEALARTPGASWFFPFGFPVGELFPVGDPPPLPQVQVPEVVGGPPIPGVSWFLGRFPSDPLSILPTVDAPVAPPREVYSPEAPPVGPGAPWMFPGGLPHEEGPAGSASSGTPTFPPVSSSSQFKPFIERDPRIDQRVRRVTEKISSLLNSLLLKGIIRQTGPDEFEIVSGGFRQPRPPGVDDDRTVGVQVGATWVDTTAGAVYFNVSNDVGSAVWVGPVGGESGTFP